jgi:hypothetical protein
MSHKKINDCTLTSMSVTFISNSSQINDKPLYHNKMSIIINQCKIIRFLIELIIAQKNNFNNSSQVSMRITTRQYIEFIQ